MTYKLVWLCLPCPLGLAASQTQGTSELGWRNGSAYTVVWAQLFSPVIENNPLSHNVSWLQFPLPLLLPLSPHLYSHLDVCPFFLSFVKNRLLGVSNHTWQTEIEKDKTETITLNQQERMNPQEEKIPRKDTRIRDPLICTLRNPKKTLNRKPSYICRGPGADLCSPCVLPLSLWAQLLTMPFSTYSEIRGEQICSEGFSNLNPRI